MVARSTINISQISCSKEGILSYLRIPLPTPLFTRPKPVPVFLT